ncbi:MAG: TIGR04282 family arsenosugar biosynthesis glycosyltransferase [Caldimonas sp.]
MNTSTTVIVMAKAPVPGFVKTRLIPTLGADGAAALADRLLHATVAQVIAADIGPVDLCCAPDPAHPAFARYLTSAAIDLSDQGEGDLGARMTRAFERSLRNGTCAVMIGTDAPALDAAMLARAALALSDVDAVFVPAFDGGYALIGLRRAAPSLFDEMPWSTPAVMERTRERLAAAGMTHIELPAVADIDEAADLVHLPPGWLP